MAITDKMWEALTTVIKMNDKVERLAEVVKSQQGKIETLTERVIRLETALEIALSRPVMTRIGATQLDERKD
ncbi:hypothetical protein B1757_07550 [Acidithiobacillus marinus]|uniref:Uncharacterized protein n=1 Tax=Acidithiobacillus marinus TaxID=187490 RepID=A0A2I1DLR4_9PROT|nr:hypothetical protein [Acidithiobacillus marinus]PKY10804.1 hypothetical protein B1757_07550 [Acidithiobacillus marinus]